MKMINDIFTATSKTIFLTVILIFGFMAIAQVVDPPISTGDFFTYLFAALGGLKGASTLAIIGVVVQILLKFLNTDLFGQWFSSLSGNIKLLIVSGLTVIGSVVTLMVQGQTFWAAVTSGGVLTALMVFANQIYQQFFQAAAPVVTLKK